MSKYCSNISGNFILFAVCYDTSPAVDLEMGSVHFYIENLHWFLDSVDRDYKVEPTVNKISWYADILIRIFHDGCSDVGAQLRLKAVAWAWHSTA